MKQSLRLLTVSLFGLCLALPLTAAAATTDTGIDTPSATTPLKFAVGGQQKMVLSQTGLDVSVESRFSGDVYAASYLYNSDMRLKQNIMPSKGLEIIEKLNGITFNWKSSNNAASGLLAQDVAKALPTAVRTKPDGMMAVDYAQLMGPMVEAIKELKAQNDKMSAEINSLRAEIAELKK